MSGGVRAQGGGVETRVAELERKQRDVYTKAESVALIAAGSVVGSAYAAYTTNADLTAIIPGDDTIPQVTEGTQILSVVLTPTSTTNKIRTRVQFEGSVSAIANLCAALFVNGASNAVRATYVTIPTAQYGVTIAMEHEFVPGSTSAQTITLRVGPAAGTARLNGNPGSRFFGGAMAATIVAEEVKA